MSLLIYISSLLITLGLFYLFDKFQLNNSSNKIIKLCCNILCFLPLILVFTFRENVGTDYMSYEKIYNGIVNRPFSLLLIITHYIEPGWVILTYISELIFKDFFAFKLLVSLVFFTYCSLLIENEKIEIKLLFTFLIFTILFFPFMNTMRQILAAIIILYSISLMLKEKYKYAIINMFLAFLIHKSALIFLFVFLLYLLYKKNVYIKAYNKKFSLFKVLEYSLILSPIVLIPLIWILNSIFKLLNITSYYIYNTVDYDINFLLYSIPPIVIYKVYSILNKKNSSDTAFLYYLTLFNVAFKSLGKLFLPFDRLCIYFFAINILLFVNYYKIIKNLNFKFNKYYTLYIVGFFSIYFVYMFYIINGHECFPYTTIF